MRFVSVLLAGVIVLAACKGGDKSAPSAAPSTTSTPTVAASAAPTAAPLVDASAAVTGAKMVDGEKFSKAFPPVGMDGTTEMVARPTKEGFAEVAYRKGTDDVAVVTITDTAAVPAVRGDYTAMTEKAAGYPLKHSGYYKSAILVADRFQVQVQSQRLKADQRKAWFAKVDVKALAALK